MYRCIFASVTEGDPLCSDMEYTDSYLKLGPVWPVNWSPHE